MFFLKAGFRGSDHPKMVRATASNMFAFCSCCGEEVHIFQRDVIENIESLLLGCYICPACCAALVGDFDDLDIFDRDDDDDETEDDPDVYEDEECGQDEDSDDEHEAWDDDDQDDDESSYAEAFNYHALQEEAFYRFKMITRAENI